MRPIHQIVCAALILFAASCKCGMKPKEDQPKQQAVAAGPAPSSRSGEHHALKRPNLGPEWAWAGQALPSGDPTTSVLKVEKIAPVEVSASAPFEYTIKVTNIAETMSLEDVTVSDHLPGAGYEFAEAKPPADRSGDMLTWKLGHMAAGESKSISVKGRAKTPGALMHCATATYAPMVCLTTNVVTAGLELTKSAPAEVIQCDLIPLRFVVKNIGTGSATNVRVTDKLPDGWTVNGERTVTFDAGTLKGGQTREFTASAKSSKTGEFVNTATATADGNISTDATARTVVRKPRLEITKKVDIENQILGRDATFTIMVTNKGDGVARDVVLRDEISGADHLGELRDGGTASGSVVTWRLGNLAPGASRTITVSAGRQSEGTITNTATAEGFCAEAVSASASSKYRGVSAILIEVVDAPDPVVIGGTATYTITVTNQGTAPDSDVVVRCTMEDAVEFVSAGGATAGTNSGADISFAPLPSLGPKQSAKWTVTVRGAKVADTRFKVAVNTHDTGRPIEETEATRIYE